MSLFPDGVDDDRGVCAAHSGIIMWMKLTAGIGGLVATLLVYQIFFQTRDMATTLTTNIAALNNRIDLTQKDIAILEIRLRSLELQEKR